MTYSEQPTEPKPSKSSQSNSLFFQVLFVFSLCVLAYVIIQKSTNETMPNDIDMATQTAVSETVLNSDVQLTPEMGEDDDIATAEINPVQQVEELAEVEPQQSTTTEGELIENTNLETPISAESDVESVVEETAPNMIDRTYTVKAGDILGKIAQKMYGSVRYMNVIEKANGLIDPDSLQEGMVLKIPAIKKQNTSSQDAMATLVQTDPHFIIHKVEKGDTIWDICKKYYGSGVKQKWLKEDNPEHFGDDDSYLSVGIELKIRKNID